MAKAMFKINLIKCVVLALKIKDINFSFLGYSHPHTLLTQVQYYKGAPAPV